MLSLCKDKSGILWIGTYDGINKFVSTKKKFEYCTFNAKDANSLSNIRVRGFAEDRKGNVWIATQGGLDVFKPSGGKFMRYFGESGVPPGDHQSTFWSVLVDRTSKDVSVLGGTNGAGVEIVTLPGGKSPPKFTSLHLSVPEYRSVFSDEVTALYQDRDGNMWAGNDRGWSILQVRGITTGIENQRGLPKTFALYQNYPNPFNPTTAISYQLSAVSQVTLKVYDVLGREVATLVDGQENAGVYKVNFNASRYASGVYFYRIAAVGNGGQRFAAIKKLMLVK